MTFAVASTDPYQAAYLAAQDHVTYWIQASGGRGSVPTALVDDGLWQGDVAALVGPLRHGARRLRACAPVTDWEPWNEPNNTGWGDGATYVTQVLAPVLRRR